MGGRTNEQTGFNEEEVGVDGEGGKVVDLVDSTWCSTYRLKTKPSLAGQGQGSKAKGREHG
jgi:hypothetical protein